MRNLKNYMFKISDLQTGKLNFLDRFHNPKTWSHKQKKYTVKHSTFSSVPTIKVITKFFKYLRLTIIAVLRTFNSNENFHIF